MCLLYSSFLLSNVDDSMPVFSLNNYKGYAKITSIHDGDGFNAVIIVDGKRKKFRFKLCGYELREFSPVLSLNARKHAIMCNKLARERLKKECGFNDRLPRRRWNPFVNDAMVWLECHESDYTGKTLVTVYRRKGDDTSIHDKMRNSGFVITRECSRLLETHVVHMM